MSKGFITILGSRNLNVSSNRRGSEIVGRETLARGGSMKLQNKCGSVHHLSINPMVVSEIGATLRRMEF
jgi:hypothetical protein